MFAAVGKCCFIYASRRRTRLVEVLLLCKVAVKSKVGSLLKTCVGARARLT